VRRAGAGAALAAVLAAGCMGGDEAVIRAEALPRLVLRPPDLKGDWTQFDVGRQRLADAPPGDRADPTRFGREGGWIARYRRRGTPQTVGPLVVESRADRFESAGGAEDELDAARGDLERAAQQVDAPDLGDDASAFRTGGGQPGVVVFFTIVWRHGNVVATVAANGFDGRLELDHVADLAEKQQARLARAAE
jgi:hypothetical protein